MTEDDLNAIEPSIKCLHGAGWHVAANQMAALVAEVRRLRGAPAVVNELQRRWSSEGETMMSERHYKHASEAYGRAAAADDIVEALSTFIMSGKLPPVVQDC